MNILEDDATVYSSARCSPVNIVFKHRCTSRIQPSVFRLVAPRKGFTSPVQEAMLFLINDLSELEITSKYDSWTHDDFLMYSKNRKLCSTVNVGDPVAFVKLDNDYDQIAMTLRL